VRATGIEEEERRRRSNNKLTALMLAFCVLVNGISYLGCVKSVVK
jgi:hypothetical protein